MSARLLSVGGRTGHTQTRRANRATPTHARTPGPQNTSRRQRQFDGPHAGSAVVGEHDVVSVDSHV